MELPGRLAEGIVQERNIVTIVDGELVGIKGEECEYLKQGSEWTKVEAHEMANLGGGQGSAIRGQAFGSGIGKRAKYITEVAALLDRSQYDLLSEDPYVPLLVIGGAGSDIVAPQVTVVQTGRSTVELRWPSEAGLNYTLRRSDLKGDVSLVESIAGDGGDIAREVQTAGAPVGFFVIEVALRSVGAPRERSPPSR